MLSQLCQLPGTTNRAELRQQIHRLENDPLVDGILVQLPLPVHLAADGGIDLQYELSPEKDADGFSYGNLGRLWSGQGRVAPCTPKGVMNLLEHFRISVAGKSAVVVGRSLIVGKPMAQLLLQSDATVTICHSRTPNISEITRRADIVVVAAGKQGLLGREDFAKGAVVIDVGIHGSGLAGARIQGDVRPEGLEDWLSAATPVPGGVGPMTIATLLENTMILAETRALRLAKEASDGGENE